jgi:hypothetical protein
MPIFSILFFLEPCAHSLTDFQTHLGAVSGEIRSLQDESLDMSVRLLNRKRVEAPVSKFLELVALPPALCKCV